jgi:hypothetical protein
MPWVYPSTVERNQSGVIFVAVDSAIHPSRLCCILTLLVLLVDLVPRHFLRLVRHSRAPLSTGGLLLMHLAFKGKV